ncbi:YveK family protein [Rubrobacter tropicus]|nr:Wzz/FepE/Etk N-terminal domain-containing protein [Rubrobacter tropicus]
MLPNGTRHAAPTIGDHDAGWPADAPRGQEVLSVRDLLETLWRKAWVILLMTILVVGAAVGYGLTQTPMYQASIKVLVGQGQGLTPESNDVIGLQQLTQSMAELAYTRTVADAVIQNLDLQTTPDEFLAGMSVEQVAETQVIEVSYTDSDPERASQIANTIGDEFSGQVSEVSSSANSITAVTWEKAAVPSSPISPNLLRNGLLALVLGLMLGVGLAFLLEYLDDSWRSPEEAMQVSGVPTFAAVREFRLPKKPKKKGAS